MGTLIHAMLEAEMKQNGRLQKAGLREKEASRRANNLESYANHRLATLSPLFKAFKEEATQTVLFEGTTELTNSTDEIDETIELCKGVFKNWLFCRGVEDLDRYDVISTEFKFEMPLIHNGFQALGWIVSGLVDCLLWDRKNEIFILREYKTTSGDPVDYQSRVSLDPQVRIYAEAVRQSGLTRGKPIKSVEYAVLKRKLPSLPKMINCKSCKGKKSTKSGVCEKCNEDGQVLSTSALDTTFDALASHLSNFPDSPEKEELLEKNKNKGWEKFICVHEHYLQDADVAETIGEVFRASEEIVGAVEEYHSQKDLSIFPKNVSHCTGSYFGCEYRELCGSRIPVENVEFRNSNWVECSDHPELDER